MSLERALLNSLQSIGAVVRRRAVLPRRASFEQIRKILRTVYKVSRRGEDHFCTLFFSYVPTFDRIASAFVSSSNLPRHLLKRFIKCLYIHISLSVCTP